MRIKREEIICVDIEGPDGGYSGEYEFETVEDLIIHMGDNPEDFTEEHKTRIYEDLRDLAYMEWDDYIINSMFYDSRPGTVIQGERLARKGWRVSLIRQDTGNLLEFLHTIEITNTTTELYYNIDYDFFSFDTWKYNLLREDMVAIINFIRSYREEQDLDIGVIG